MLYLICSAILGALCLLACRITRQRQLSSSKCALRALTAQKNRRALIVIAHPDDEAMFFVPTIQSCSAAGLTVELLCLSDGAVPRGCVRGRACGIISHHFAGNAYGLGTQRQVELARSCAILQLVPPSIVVDEELQDGLHTTWPRDVVARHVQQHVQRFGMPALVITFDAGGVSGHPNHVHTSMGVQHWLLEEFHFRQPAPVLLSLVSVPLWRKFIGVASFMHCGSQPASARFPMEISFGDWFTLMADHLQKYVAMVAQSRLLAPNLKEMTLHVYSSTAKPNRIAREVVRNHLLALRWMNPAANIVLRETRGAGSSSVEYTLFTGEKSSFGIEEEHTSVAVVGKVLQVAREPESASGRAAAAVPAPAKEILQ